MIAEPFEQQLFVKIISKKLEEFGISLVSCRYEYDSITSTPVKFNNFIYFIDFSDEDELKVVHITYPNFPVPMQISSFKEKSMKEIIEKVTRFFVEHKDDSRLI